MVVRALGWQHLRHAHEVVGMEETYKLLIIVPSMGRPKNAQRLLDQILATTTSDDEVYITFAVDHSDPTQYNYPVLHTEEVVGGSMVKALNEVAVAQADDFEYLAFLGDDTLPHGDWYAKVMEALQSQKNSIVYGNDLIHGEGLPTSVFMDANIVRTLGYMAPPNQRQLFVDNYWKALGVGLGTLQYLPETIIEHLHPIVQKAPSDASYEQAYSQDRWAEDKEAFIEYMEHQFQVDLDRLT